MNQNMDDIIKEKLFGHSVDVPKDAWSVIDASINPSQGSRKLFWLAIPIGLLLVLGGIFWMNGSDQSALSSSESTFLDQNSNQNKSDQDQGGPDANDLNLLNIDQNAGQINLEESNNIEENDQATVVKENHGHASTTDRTTGLVNQNLSDSEYPNQHKTASGDSRVTAFESIGQGQSQNSLLDNEQILVDKTSIVLNNRLASDQNSPTSATSLINNNSSSTLDDRSLIADRQINSLAYLDKANVQSLNLSPIKISDRILKRLESPCLFGKGKECYDFKNKVQPTTFYAEFLIGPDVVNRNMTSRTSELDYLNLRENTEKMEISFSTALRGGLVTRSGFGVKAGLLYSQIHEQFNYQGLETRITNIPGIPQPIIETGTVKRTIYNTLRTIDLPILIGYEMDMGPYILALYGGGALNMGFSQEGEILESSNNPSPLGSNGLDIFNNKTGASVLGSLGLYYKLNDKMQLMFEPNIRYRLGSVTKDSYSIEQKYWTVGLHVGLRLKLQ